VAILAKPLSLLAAAELMLAMLFAFDDPFDEGITDAGMGSGERDLGGDECEMDGNCWIVVSFCLSIQMNFNSGE
jgi:hypothetical protein